MTRIIIIIIMTRIINMIIMIITRIIIIIMIPTCKNGSGRVGRVPVTDPGMAA